MIVFGGILFWTIVLIAILLECIFIYSRKSLLSFFVLVVLGVSSYFLVSDFPSVDWKFIAGYFVLAFIWAPLYWYCYLHRAANDIKRELRKGKTLEDIYEYNGELSKHIKVERNFKKTDGLEGRNSYSVELKNPKYDEITVNGLFFFISIPIFFLEDFITRFLDSLYNFMQRVKKSLEDSINGDFNGKSS